MAGDLNIFVSCDGSLSVLLILIVSRSVVVVLKFLFLPWFSVSVWFLYGMFVVSYVLLEDNVYSISFGISLLLISLLFVKLDIVGWLCKVHCFAICSSCLHKKQLTLSVETNIRYCVSSCIIRNDSGIFLSVWIYANLPSKASKDDFGCFFYVLIH